MGLVQEVLGKVFQSHIIPVKVVGLKRMHMLRSLILTPAGTRSKAHTVTSDISATNPPSRQLEFKLRLASKAIWQSSSLHNKFSFPSLDYILTRIPIINTNKWYLQFTPKHTKTPAPLFALLLP